MLWFDGPGGCFPPRLHFEELRSGTDRAAAHRAALDRAAWTVQLWMLRAVGAAGAAIFGAAALSLVDMGAKRVAQSPPGTTALKVLTPQVAAGSSLRGAALWSSSPLVALVLRRPG